MEYRKLGKAGVRVSRICLGTAFRGQGDAAACARVIERAIDLGCNFVDCANTYGNGRSEEILGRAIGGKRGDLVITSKVCSPIGQDPNDRGLSRYHILREVERTLVRLQTDHLDLYFLHSVDPETDLQETLRAMEDLVRQGKVRYVGASNYESWRLVELLWTAEARGWDRVACVQNQYNLLNRAEVEPEVLPVCRRHGLGLITYSPLAVGLLTGRLRRPGDAPGGTPWSGERLPAALAGRAGRVLEQLERIAAERQRTPAQVALAWILDHPEVTAPIIGPDLPEQVDESLAAVDLTLAPQERQALDRASSWQDPAQYL